MPYRVDGRELIGRRIRRQRLRLGMTQVDLAIAVRRTQSWVSKVERGSIELDRTGLINVIAAALHCHPNILLERPYMGDVRENQWQVAAASILRELRRYDLTPAFEGVPRSSGDQWRDMTRLHRLRDAAANVAILQTLPDFLRESLALADRSSGREREEAFAIYAVACKFAHTAAHALGHSELIAMTCERAAWAAQSSGDPSLPAVADWMRVWDMWATADWESSVRLSDKALASVQSGYDAGDPSALRVWGSLQLRAAVSCARNGEVDEAETRLGYAQEASRRAGAGGGPVFDRHSLTFSAGNVQIHRVSVALEAGDQARALQLNDRADPELVAALPKSRQGHHAMDLSRAWLWAGDRAKALEELERAERLAPQLVRNHPIARATLRRIVYGERNALRQRLRTMSDRFHLDDQGVFR
ncbi:helix-turn-helix domain-containing protein [Streptomyces sp. NPDC002490]|uniref:helix-turn-helix domain-containing protein n=1 Tax=Streptomyces sp. NPDC002490 TaxID=3154416 RepID=UPI0033241186